MTLSRNHQTTPAHATPAPPILPLECSVLAIGGFPQGSTTTATVGEMAAGTGQTFTLCSLAVPPPPAYGGAVWGEPRSGMPQKVPPRQMVACCGRWRQKAHSLDCGAVGA